MTFKQQMHNLRKVLGMETAIVARIEDGNYEIVELDSDLPVFNVGDQFELCNTYCTAVYTSQETIVYNNVGEIEEMLLHPVYVAMQLLSYIGTPIYQDGELWGTLNFSATEARNKDFDYKDIKTVEQLAKLYGQERIAASV